MILSKPKIEVDLGITWIYQSILWILRHKSYDTLFSIPMMVAISMYAFSHFHQMLITQQNRVAVTISCIVLVSYKSNVNWWMHHWVMDMTYDAHVNIETDVAYYLILI